MSKKRAFVRYSKQGKIVPGSLILTGGSYPNGPSTWKEVPADLCCDNTSCIPANYGDWRVVTGGEAGDGVVLINDLGECPTYTFIGPNDDEDTGWVYLTQYFSTTTCLQINYEWTSFDEGTVVDRPVYWIQPTQPTGIPGDTASQVGSTPADGEWNITVPGGQWFAIGIYSSDSCCGRGFLEAEICEVECPEPTTTTSTSSTTTTTTTICDSCWSTVNFSGTTFNNGDPIPQALNQTDWNNANIAGTPIWAYYNYDPSYEPIYGRLYNWHVVNDPRGIAPTGYHVPTITEWNNLITCLGGESVAAGKMKTTGTLEGGTGLWLAPNTGATNNMEGCNECPFSALPGSGIREYGEPQTDINGSTVFWASTQSNSTNAWSVELYYNDAAIYPATTTKTVGNSIRFKKDIC